MKALKIDHTGGCCQQFGRIKILYGSSGLMVTVRGCGRAEGKLLTLRRQ